MPAIIDVPNSDFLESNPQLPHVPDLEYHLTAGSNFSFSLGDWPSFGELSCLSLSPISTSSSASLYSETPSTSQDLDWSSLAGFIDFPTLSQPSSQTWLSTPPSTLPDSQEDSLLIPLLHSYGTVTSVCHKRGRAELDEDPSCNFVSLNDVPQRPIQRRKVLESAYPMPSKRVCSPSVALGDHPSLDPSLPSENPLHPSPHSVVEPVSASVDVSLNTSLIDCNSIPSPPNGMAWICMSSLFSYPKYDLTLPPPF